VEGAAAGAGFSLALACDLIVAGNTAKFVMAYVKVGLTPDGGGSWFLARALPRQLATEIILEGKPVLASRLHDFGLVNRLVPDGTALDAALAGMAPDAGAEAFQTVVYEVGKTEAFGFENLRDWFKALYETLLGSAQGPRMGSFIALYGLANTRALIAEALAG